MPCPSGHAAPRTSGDGRLCQSVSQAGWQAGCHCSTAPPHHTCRRTYLRPKTHPTGLEDFRVAIESSSSHHMPPRRTCTLLSCLPRPAHEGLACIRPNGARRRLMRRKCSGVGVSTSGNLVVHTQHALHVGGHTACPVLSCSGLGRPGLWRLSTLIHSWNKLPPGSVGRATHRRFFGEGEEKDLKSQRGWARAGARGLGGPRSSSLILSFVVTLHQASLGPLPPRLPSSIMRQESCRLQWDRQSLLFRIEVFYRHTTNIFCQLRLIGPGSLLSPVAPD